MKQDLRAALPEKGSVDSKGTGITIRCYSGLKTITVEYRYDASTQRVTRAAPDGGPTTFGAEGLKGKIVQFRVDPVEKLPGFYRIDAVFERPGAAKPAAGAAISPNRSGPAAPQGNFEFHSLVNKRSRESTDRDLQCHDAYQE